MIRAHQETIRRLKEQRLTPRESYEEIINRLLDKEEEKGK